MESGWKDNSHDSDTQKGDIELSGSDSIALLVESKSSGEETPAKERGGGRLSIEERENDLVLSLHSEDEKCVGEDGTDHSGGRQEEGMDESVRVERKDETDVI